MAVLGCEVPSELKLRSGKLLLPSWYSYLGDVFLVSGKDGASPSYYAGKKWFADVSRGIFLRFSEKDLDALVYFRLFKFAQRIGFDLVLMASAIRRCVEVYWSKSETKRLFVGLNFSTAEGPGLVEASVKM